MFQRPGVIGYGQGVYPCPKFLVVCIPCRLRTHHFGAFFIGFQCGFISGFQIHAGTVFFRSGQSAADGGDIAAVFRQYVKFAFCFQAIAVFGQIIADEGIGHAVVGIAAAGVQGQPRRRFVFEVEADIPFIAFSLARHGHGEVGV